MKIPLLPKSVDLRLDAHLDENGNPKPDTPLFVCRPVGMLEVAEYLDETARGRSVSLYARAFAEHVSHIEGLDVDGEHFDPKKEAHVAALDPGWCIQLGRKLLAATRFTDEERGKSS